MTMTDVMMMLGRNAFAINTAAYDGFRHQAAWRWPAQERIESPPARQFIGPDSQTITLSGFILPHFNRGGLAALERLRKAADDGRPLLLVDGQGFVHGDWVITSLEETRTAFFADGAPRRVDFTIALGDYGGEGDSQAPAFAAPFALLMGALE